MPPSEQIAETPGVDQLICFALYSASHAMNRAYKSHLAPLGLTYPQYITLTALWEADGVTIGTLCTRLMTETSTMAPIVKRLEQLGHLTRKRGTEDERQVFVHLTKSGRKLQDEADTITRCIIADTNVAHAKLDKLVSEISAMRDSLIQNNQ